MKQQESTKFDKQISNNLILFKPQVFEKFKTQLGEKWDEVQRVYNKGDKVSEFSLFSTI